jgi:ribosomal protein S19E (S16A)
MRGAFRVTDPDTSRDAAELIDDAGYLHIRDYVMFALAHAGPLTHDDLWLRYHEAGGPRSASRIRHVVKKLEEDGLVTRVDRDGRTIADEPGTRFIRTVDSYPWMRAA